MGIDTGEKLRILDSCNNRSNAPRSENAGVKVDNGESARGEGWENIPPYRQLKVLLVEDDDSTRHVVAALLRNCGYQVVSAANGLQAWSLLLDEQSREFDLVLTDVVMPGLSGIGLLSRIMHRESLKKIPVIMMSSHDSTDVVFKCLSKGASDFLVKPVRKNELKNLWQHSWRRSQSSSGSGCESETGRLACGGSENGESGSEDVRISDQSDNGSATQSSCTKKVLVELGSPRKARQQKRSLRRNKDSQTVDEQDVRAKHDEEVEEEGTTCEQNMVSDQAAAARPVELVDLIGSIAGERSERRAHDEAESEMGGSNNPEIFKDSSSDPTSTSKLELSLKSSSPVDNRENIFRPSGGASAFSRYNTPRQPQQQYVQLIQQPQPQQQQQQQQYVKLIQQQQQQQQQPECQQQRIGRRELTVEVNRNSEGRMGTCSSPAEKLVVCPEQHMVATPVNFPVQYTALVSYDHQPMPLAGTAYYYAQPAIPPWQHAFSPQRKEADMVLEQQQQQQRSFQTFTNILAHHHHYHMEQQRQQNSHAEAALNNRFVSTSRDVSPSCMDTPGCGSTTAVDGKQFNNGFSGGSHGNGSMSGSNNGSNGFNNCSNMNTATTTTNTNVTNTSGLVGDSGSGNFTSPGGVPSGPEQNRVRREAALNKFRLKRKERCFEKKVRYQSRKRLAEQRPRVRGQFVSQAVYDSSVSNVADI